MSENLRDRMLRILSERCSPEEVQTVALYRHLVLAAREAGVDLSTPEKVDAYLDWAKEILTSGRSALTAEFRKWGLGSARLRLWRDHGVFKRTVREREEG